MQCKGGCGFFGSESNQGYCSMCGKKAGITSTANLATPQTLSLNVRLLGKEDLPRLTNLSLSLPISTLQLMVQCVTDVEPKYQRLMILGQDLDRNKKLGSYAPKDGNSLWVYNKKVYKDDNGHYMDEQVKIISVRDNQEKNETKIYPPPEEENKRLEEYQTVCYWCASKEEKEEKEEQEESECKFCSGKKKLSFSRRVDDPASFVGDLTDVEIVISINCGIHPDAYGINLENLISNVVLVSKLAGTNIPLEVATGKSDSDYNDKGDVKMVFKAKKALEPGTVYLFKIDATIKAGIRRGTFAPENSVYFSRFLSGLFTTKEK